MENATIVNRKFGLFVVAAALSAQRYWQHTTKGAGFAMVTCNPNELVAPIHPKAMITILHESDWDTWLQGTYHNVLPLQEPYPADRMTVRGPVFPTRGGKPA